MILVLLFLLHSLTNLVNSDGYTTSFGCIIDKNATVSYKNNVNILFSDFINQASVTGYYNTSVGNSPNRVYGYYMCRGDTDPNGCRDCIVNTTKFAQDADCNHVDGVSYSETCVFRYANHSMYGVWQEGLIVSVVPIGNPEFKTRQYNKTLGGTMEALIDKAAFGCNDKGGSECVPGFATRESNVTGDETIYSLALCTPDIVGVNCSKCLQFALVGLGSYGSYRGAQIYKPNCLLMYDNTSFYEVNKVIPNKGEGPKLLVDHLDFYLLQVLCCLSF